MKRLILGSLVGIAALAVGTLVPARAFVPPDHRVVANASRHSANPGVCERIAYDATSSGGVVSGWSKDYQFPCDVNGNATGPVSSSLVGNVTCIDVVGNEITLGAVTTQATGFFAGYTVFQKYSHDVSTPSSPPSPDTDLTVLGVSGCTRFAVSEVPLYQGDIRIAY